MYEHPSYTYARITDEQTRAGRELERRRSMLEHPSQIVRREPPLIALLKRVFRSQSALEPPRATAPMSAARGTMMW